MEKAEKRNSFQTEFHPCSLEYSSFLSNKKHSSIFLCGLYQLDESSGTRNGCINCYQPTSSSPLTSKQCESGILDMKILNNMVATVVSTGSLVLYESVVQTDGMIDLKESFTVNNADEGFFLSVDWDSHRQQVDMDAVEASYQSINRKLAVSTQESSLLIYDLTETELVESRVISNTHCMRGVNMPTWIVAYDYHSKNMLISGGDDCTCKLWDLREGGSGGGAPSHTLKHHTAGVTSAQWHPSDENIFASGSYDEQLLVWDKRQLSSPMLTIQTGGGVWRTKWITNSRLPNNNRCVDYLVTANMHGGSAVHKLCHSEEEREWTCAATAIQKDAQTSNQLDYGVDCIRRSSSSSSQPIDSNQENDSSESDDCLLIASCSFYDDKVYIWETQF